MGYYTYYTLKTEPDLSTLPDVQTAISEHEEMQYAFGPIGDPDDATKWYEWEKDMVEFSRRFPEVLFTLFGEGEESGDFWVAYFRNGKKQLCRGEIVYPEFSEDSWEEA